MFATPTPSAVPPCIAFVVIHALAAPHLEYKAILLPPADPKPVARYALQTIDLSPRERQVLHWVAQGKTDWEIGEILFISSKTVNYHVEKAKRKLKAATRMQAALLAIQLGFVDAPLTSSAAATAFCEPSLPE